jgi:hypothetical protein
MARVAFAADPRALVEAAKQRDLPTIRAPLGGKPLSARLKAKAPLPCIGRAPGRLGETHKTE